MPGRFGLRCVRIWVSDSDCRAGKWSHADSPFKPAEAPKLPRPMDMLPRGSLRRAADFCRRGCRVVSSTTNASTPITLGFLTILQEPTGWLGGYLVTNGWGRPVEFRLTTAVQPNRVQAALYGPTLPEYLLADLIGKTLVEKTATKPDLVVTDTPAALPLRSRVEMPVVALRSSAATDTIVFEHPRASSGLILSARFAEDRTLVSNLLDRVDTAVELAEPFARIREAIAEARKLGVTHRAA